MAGQRSGPVVRGTRARFAVKAGPEVVDLLSVPLQLVTDPPSELPAARGTPDHRSPRWLGGLSIALSALTLSQLFFAFDALSNLFR